MNGINKMTNSQMTQDEEWKEVERLLKEFAKDLGVPIENLNEKNAKQETQRGDTEQTPVMGSGPWNEKPLQEESPPDLHSQSEKKYILSEKEKKCYLCGNGTFKITKSSGTPMCDSCLDSD